MTVNSLQELPDTNVADLLLLQQKLRECSSIAELGYFVVNGSSKLFSNRTAFLCLSKGSGCEISAVSGLPFPAEHTPFSQWSRDLATALLKSMPNDVEVIELSNFPATISSKWQEFLPANAVWLPLRSGDQDLGGLVLARDTSWSEDELSLLKYWCAAIAHALAALVAGKRKVLGGFSIPRRRLWLGILGLAVLAMWFPVSLSILAPVEVVAKNPVIVRSPINGVIASVLVEPNQLVDAGDALIQLDDTGLRARIDVASQELAIARAEYRRADQAAVTDRRASAQFPMLRARIEQSEAQLAYENSLLERSSITAERAGVIIVSRIDELEGMPVDIGQKILTLADPNQVDLEMWIAVGDSIPLTDRAEVEAFLNVRPQQSYQAEIDYVNYQAEVSPDGIFAFRARANFDEGSETLRIGWRGTAKIYGEEVSLYYLLFRRPLSGIRQWLGL
jgi:hypothetical protein